MPELSQPWSFAGFSTRNGSERLYDLDLVKQDLLNHFYTRRGELDWAPEYGSDIPFLLFENQNSETLRLVRADIRRVIGSDARLELVSLEVYQFPRGYRAEVQVRYVGRNPVVSMQLEFDRRNFNEAE